MTTGAETGSAPRPRGGAIVSLYRKLAMAAAIGVLAAGCASAPSGPKQIITVLPNTSTASQSAQWPVPPPDVPVQVVPPPQGMPPPQAPEPVVPPPAASSAFPGQSHYNQGVMLFHQGNSASAMQQFRLALAENPHDIKARDNLGVLLQQSGDSHEAIEQYRAALQTDPNNKLTNRLLARALAQSGNIDAAIDQYQVAVKLDPDNPGVHNDFGVALHFSGNNRAAIYEYRKALALDPRDFAAHRNLADALNDTGDVGAAVKEMRIASELKPDDLALHNALASLLFEQNDLNAAMAQWQAANKLDPKNPDALAGMSIGYWKMGLKRQALSSYRQAVALAPGYFCDDVEMKARGHWNGPALNALHHVAKEPGAPSCSGT
jgi:Flp pilus assembly protein TadD